MNTKNFKIFICTNSAILKIKKLIYSKKYFNFKLRIYITGGGCNGFQYKFKLDDKIKKNDLLIDENGAKLLIDPISIQYIMGGILDYKEELEGSRFIINNPSAKTTCSCGYSFSI